MWTGLQDSDLGCPLQAEDIPDGTGVNILQKMRKKRVF